MDESLDSTEINQDQMILTLDSIACKNASSSYKLLSEKSITDTGDLCSIALKDLQSLCVTPSSLSETASDYFSYL